MLTSTDRKFTKPLVLLINNRSYSDAEILPSAFRTLGLGKLVGQPTGGFVIGTSGYRLIDGTISGCRAPGCSPSRASTWRKQGVVPDFLRGNAPGSTCEGD